jgi:hypothetical protein
VSAATAAAAVPTLPSHEGSSRGGDSTGASSYRKSTQSLLDQESPASLAMSSLATQSTAGKKSRQAEDHDPSSPLPPYAVSDASVRSEDDPTEALSLKLRKLGKWRRQVEGGSNMPSRPYGTDMDF